MAPTLTAARSHAQLSDFLTRVWGPGTAVDVGPQARTAPAGQRFVVLPSPEQPRLLVPLGSPRMAAGALTANLGLRRGSDRLRRMALAAAVRSGYYERFGRQLWAGVGSTDETLLEVLRERWTPEVAGLSVGVRDVTPNYKPTFVAVDARGTALGYLKVGWNTATVARLARERAAMEAMADRVVPGLRSPRVLAEVDWNDRTILVIEPLPRKATRFDPAAPAPLHLVREAIGDGGGRTAPLEQVLAGRDAAPPGLDDELVALADGYAATLASRFAGVAMPVGVTHGDWVPWNLGRVGATVWAWDWEHSQLDGCPLGEVAHWYVQLAHINGRQPLRDAFVETAPVVRERLFDAGCDKDQVSAALGLAVLTATGRAVELFDGSGLWRVGVRQSLVDLLSDADLLVR